MKKIIFYGDSNTYGYDPRGFFGMRYPKEVRWTEIVRDRFKGKIEITEEGQNGRSLPEIQREEGFLRSIMGALSDKDILFVMLGTNDILLTDHPDADRAVQKMAKLLDWIKAEDPVFETIVIGPVPISGASFDMKVYHDESIRMSLGFKSVCEERGVAYYDAADWDIRLTYDGVHFSEEGCRDFAEQIIRIIRERMEQRVRRHRENLLDTSVKR